ncbi:ATP-binding protein [Phenylobacterium sp.]|jgi:signal transduction histidine kinase/AmiR/NasT family two-component response regulator|uniref:ATP-binding protein n=1 Tax=Phenylobacterium sp. TaxID=1871053 RepID=UPI002F92BB94
MKLDDLKISTKVVLPTVILAVVALICTGIGFWQEQQVARAAQILVEHRSPAEVMSARFNRRVSVVGYSAYRTLIFSEDPAAAQRASAELDKAYHEGRESLRLMARYDPATAGAAAMFAGRMDAAYRDARRGADLALAGDPAAAKHAFARLDDAVASFSRDAKAWGDVYHEDTAAMIRQAAERARLGRITSLALAVAAAAAGAGFALWIGATRIARPIGRLAEAMDALSAGELDTPLYGAERKDEIGAMARSVRVFRDNAQALRQAQAADVAKSEFLANMSHEIRTPLNGVLGMTQVIEADELTPLQRERIRVVRESGQALLGLLNDVLDLSKIEAGKLELCEAPFDLQKTLSAACATFEGAAAAKDLELILGVQADVRGVWMGDALRLRQVISNLVSNALKFTESGSVTISACRDATDGPLILRIRDTGIGIDADVVPRLFAKFAQADASTTRRYGGTGLGLSICRELVELMGGEISVASTAGAGSTFTVVLPLTQVSTSAEALDEEAAAQPVELSGTDALRILAAEDNPTNQLVLRSLLQPLGAELVIVPDGRAAVQAFAGADFDIVLMDVQMPEMNGEDATREIRKLEQRARLRRTPIIALSANVLTHQLDAYLKAGMDAHVAKPIEVEKLFSTIASLLHPAETAQPVRRGRA